MTKVISISGRQRAGKDTFARLLKNQLVNSGFSCKIYSFAFALKNELKETIQKRFGLNAFSDDSSEKEVFRPLLIEIGRAKREETNGRYWADIVEKEIIQDAPDYAIIADQRYIEGESDIVKNFGGIKVHISKWDLSRNGAKLAIPSNNLEENKNDPLVRANCDYVVEWTAPQNNETLDNWCNAYVTEFINKYADFFSKSKIRA